MMEFGRQIVVGIVFDVSMQHHADSRRYIDIIKESLVGFAVKMGLNCGVYVSHPDNHVMPRSQGLSVSSIVSYAENINFKIFPAISQCVDMISANEADDKYIILITDRYLAKNRYQYEKACKYNNCKNCRFLYMGIGKRYDRKDFAEMTACEVFHLDEPHQIVEKLIELTGV